MFPRWSRSKCIKINLVFGAVLALISRAGEAKPLPPLLQQVSDKYAKSVTISADFSQQNENPTTGIKKISTGKIFVKRPGKIRWETKKPDENLLVGNGFRFWFYTPPFEPGEHGQVIEKKSSEVQSQLANALLAGEFSSKNVTIQKKTDSSFILIPKPHTAGTVVRATVEINPEKKWVQKVILEHQGGNSSEISLSAIELGRDLSESLFVFTPPPHTDKVSDLD